MKHIQTLAIVVLTMAIYKRGFSQELYVYSDPASNVPAKSLSLKYGGKWIREKHLLHGNADGHHRQKQNDILHKGILIRTLMQDQDTSYTYC